MSCVKRVLGKHKSSILLFSKKQVALIITLVSFSLGFLWFICHWVSLDFLPPDACK